MRKRALTVTLFILSLLAVTALIRLVATTSSPANVFVRHIFGIKEVEVEVEVEKIVYVETEVEVEVHWYLFHATGYSPDDPSQGTNRIMSSGNEVYEGAIATDPSIIPTGTRVEIRGLPDGRDGIYTAEDGGAAIQGFEVDIFCENKGDARKINCMVWIRILSEGEQNG